MSKQGTKAPRKKEEYYVAYLDVLGFKELVNKSPEKVELYYNVIHDTLEKINADALGINRQLISDSCVLACERNDVAFFHLLRAVQTIQKDCILNSIYIRGAISIGTIKFDNERKVVYGNGLIKAYLLESNEKFPRVIIDPAILRFQERTKEDFCAAFNSVETSLDGASTRQLKLIFNENGLQNPLLNYVFQGKIFVAYSERMASDDLENIGIVYDNLRNSIYENEHAYEKLSWIRDHWILSYYSVFDPCYFWNSALPKKEDNKYSNYHLNFIGL